MLRRPLFRLCSSKLPSVPPESPAWLTSAAWAGRDVQYPGVQPDQFLLPSPVEFLTPRAVVDVEPAEKLLTEVVAENATRYEGIDVRDPKSLAVYEGERPSFLTLGGQVRAVSEFVSGHLAHQVSMEEWKNLFDLKYLEMDLMYWLYVLHLHIITRRASTVPLEKWNRRREVLLEIQDIMFRSWVNTSEEVMGRPPLSKIRNYIQDMYIVTAINFEEAFLYDGAGCDLMLLGFLVKFCPLPRPEDIPFFTFYTLVHYIRFHVALFDRIPDETIAKGNFNFLSPTDPRIFQAYGDVQLDEVIRGWKLNESH